MATTFNPNDSSDIPRPWHSHWPLLALALLSLTLLLTNLGTDSLWEDEGDTAVLAGSILKYGVPKAWDGVTFTDSVKGTRENRELTMVSHPWAQFYVTAASFACFGRNAFAARLPFALAGWLTIFVVYFLVVEVTNDRRAALTAALLLVLSVQFLLWSRQCRHYALNMLLSCILIWIFSRLKSFRSGLLFALTAILLFHTQPFALVLLGVLGILTLIYPSLGGQRRAFWLSLPAILLCTVPWIIWAQAGYSESTQRVTSFPQFFRRIAQYFIECASCAPLIGLIILLLALVLRRKFAKQSWPIFTPGKELALFIITALCLAGFAVALSILQSSNLAWLQGLRYAPVLLPLTLMCVAILLTKLSEQRLVVWLGLLLLFGFTQFAYLAPWLCGYHDYVWPEQTEELKAHPPLEIANCFVRGEQISFLRSLSGKNPGVVSQACAYLRDHAQPDDGVITNYSWEPLYFHTRLKQCLTILPTYSIRDNAMSKGLPDYVFGIGHARWIVWRTFWEGYQGYRWGDISAEIERQGGVISLATELTETGWENRENLHFRRFAGNQHLFPWPEVFPPAAVLRIDWPDQPH